MNLPHLVVDISAHGFGHIAQTAAVLNALDGLHMDLTIRSAAPEKVLHERIKRPFKLVPYQQDKGMVMVSAVEVDVLKTLAWYQDFHQDFKQRIKHAAQDLAALKPDLLFANVPYLSLLASRTLKVPSLALCSLNWADVFQHYCGHLSAAPPIYEQILEAYQQPDYFLQATPSMPMLRLGNTKSIAPIVSQGHRNQSHLQQSTQNRFEQFILVGLGGIGVQYPLEAWPELAGVAWIFDNYSTYTQRPDFFSVNEFGLAYIDILASCDLVLTKTGYGTQTEAVINQVPAICIQRPDWPESPYLQAWHLEHGEVEFIDWADLQTEKFKFVTQKLLKQTWTKPPVHANGACEAASLIQSYLG